MNRRILAGSIALWSGVLGAGLYQSKVYRDDVNDMLESSQTLFEADRLRTFLKQEDAYNQLSRPGNLQDALPGNKTDQKALELSYGQPTIRTAREKYLTLTQNLNTRVEMEALDSTRTKADILGAVLDVLMLVGAGGACGIIANYAFNHRRKKNHTFNLNDVVS